MNLTNEELRAMAMYELRVAGFHPDYIKLLLDSHDPERLIGAVADLDRICDPGHPWRHPYDAKTDFVFKKRPK